MGQPPAAAGPTVKATSPIDDCDCELAHDFISLFGRALDARDGSPPTTPGMTPTEPCTKPTTPGTTPTTARGWLELAAIRTPARPPPAPATRSR